MPEEFHLLDRLIRHEWLPTDSDREYVQSLMQKPVTEPGKMANWVGAPAHGINHQEPEFEYVRAE